MAYTTIDDPSAYFQTAIYTGNGTGQAITFDGNSDMQPDFFWGKCRSTSSGHHLQNSTTGVKPFLVSNSTGAENTDSNNTDFLSYDSNGFTLGASYQTDINHDTRTYVAWNWKANGGTTASNTDGTITSTVQANTDAGFSIISYTGNGSDGATIGHGLNQTPEIFFPKCLSTSTNWEMYYFPTGGTRQYGYLNLTNAFDTWPHNAPSSTIISLSGSGDSNGNGRTNIGYAFHSVQGYSKIGTYKGNGSSTVGEGPFIYTGFKPAWTIIKRTDASSDGWYIHDSTRSPNNVINTAFRANVNNAESTENIDYLSNGFAIRIGANNNFNNASGTYFYMAFAESPFVSSEGVPTTAR